MAQTINDIKVPSTDWVSVNTLSGLSIGTSILIQNKAPAWILLYESATKPNAALKDGSLLTNLEGQEPSKMISSGSLEIWAKSTIEGCCGRINVQTLA
ncbi:hypothetical protein KLEP7_gp194 [Pseudaeromonas phage vB_PpeM_ KLEP7]|nr:hypothetical protein KLEP7_gp194 [Pseudaeromonas phage vB_PpeM_ KLEP7]